MILHAIHGKISRRISLAREWIWFWYRSLALTVSHPGPRATSISGTVKVEVPTAGEPAADVVMCVFRRVDRLPETLADLEAQKGVRVRLHLWNNNWSARSEVDRMVAETTLNCSVVHSRKNAGGFGRFFLAQSLAGRDRSPEGPVIFIDDDQRLGTGAILTLIAESRPKTISGIWAFAFENSDDYWGKRCVNPGEEADYVGTGGMVSPLGLYQEPGLFRCPARYWFVEDLWLSYYVSHVAGYRLRGSAADITIVKDEKNQWPHLRYVKTRFLRYLVRNRGWVVGEPTVTDDGAGESRLPPH